MQLLSPQDMRLPLPGSVCQFSPVIHNRLAVGTAQLFGICGVGCLHIVEFSLQPMKAHPKNVQFTPLADKLMTSPVFQPAFPSNAAVTPTHIMTQPSGTMLVPASAQKMFNVLAKTTGTATRRAEASFSSLSTLRIIASLHTEDAICDCSWANRNEDVIAAACGDGVVRVWNIAPGKRPPEKKFPVALLRGHRAETSSVQWSPNHESLLLSASWDATAKLWDLSKPSLYPLASLEHNCCVYGARFSSHIAGAIASVGSDGQLRIFDTRTLFAPAMATASRGPTAPVVNMPSSEKLSKIPQSPTVVKWEVPGNCWHTQHGHARSKHSHHFAEHGQEHHDIRNKAGATGGGFLRREIHAHKSEALCLEWSTGRMFEIYTGAADGSVRVWDLRNLASQPVLQLQPHTLAVRVLRCNPLNSNIIASASYDTSVKVFSIQAHGYDGANGIENYKSRGTSFSNTSKADQQRSTGDAVGLVVPDVKEMAVHTHHREFVMGLDWSPFLPSVIASTSWDRHLYIWEALTNCIISGISRPPSALKQPRRERGVSGVANK